ncbi:MAG: four helix bundle protein [Kiritimatiellia bacterium]
MNEEENIQDSQEQQDNDMGTPETQETQQQGGPPRTFRDQPIYQLAFDFQQKVYELTKSFPEEELYALTEPLRLASRKIGAAVAEAWVKRRFQSQYPGKLAEVEAHAAASDHWLGTAEQTGFVTPEVIAELRVYIENIRGNVWRMTPRVHHVHGGAPDRGDRRNFRNDRGAPPPRDEDRQPRDSDRPRPPQRHFRNNTEGGGGRYYNRNNRSGGGAGGYYPPRERDLREPGEPRDAEQPY